MSSRIRRAFTILLTAALGACAVATPYQPLNRGEGYADQKIEGTRYRITFAGNAATPRQTVENYLLYRAAELTLASGFDYFVMADHSTEKETSYTQSVSAFGGFGRYGWYPHGGGFGVGFGSSSPSSEYMAQTDILMYSGAKREGDVSAFNAREVRENLEATIVRPPVKGAEIIPAPAPTPVPAAVSGG
ncbi:MAG TPA: hypothetical protein VM074_10370 [Solimonas sp.]|nr:hypothetical protein [Solimonas sp.]